MPPGFRLQTTSNGHRICPMRTRDTSSSRARLSGGRRKRPRLPLTSHGPALALRSRGRIRKRRFVGSPIALPRRLVDGGGGFLSITNCGRNTSATPLFTSLEHRADPTRDGMHLIPLSILVARNQRRLITFPIVIAKPRSSRGGAMITRGTTRSPAPGVRHASV